MLETAALTWQITKKILATTKQVFGGGVGKRLIGYNPAVGIDLKAVIGPKPQARKRVMLSEKELSVILPDIDDKIGRENGLMLRILLATCSYMRAHWRTRDGAQGTDRSEARNVGDSRPQY